MIQWPKLQLGRYIRAVTGHNNLLYHLHNIDPEISPLCRFCLEKNEEFFHLAHDCPPLWWERHNISSQEPGKKWSPQQIINFTFIPRINDAFVKPLYVMNTGRGDRGPGDPDDPDDVNPLPPDSDDTNSVTESLMEVSSLDPSSDDDDGMSIVSVVSD